ncbi:GNS1/SUR4 family-domain-containing protein [Xylariales sp. PMI_506]|nr:GNS1/SUR4 family-domain-containing protein [Xylariales sp. PMI_506]
MASPSVYIEAPQSFLFKFPPPAEPQAIPPPHFNVPFTIPDGIFQAALDPKVPLTIAATYAVTAKLLNIYNTSTGKKPWAISKTTPFRIFVILHNLFLAVYSAWTFVGMFKALRTAIVSPAGPNGLAGTVDSFCKLNGPAGFGNAATYIQGHGWDNDPSRLAEGRLWNEGLAFYGWIFYLSKFYEVLDTFIILAKGKLSSTLQTYHHAGAMMCMWAGMRYMSAPIWMFAFVNSFIHALMYTYYTITAFNIRVPTSIKRTLTTCQISQFLVGVTYAMAHSFVYYTIPVQVPVSKSEAAVTSVVAAAATEAASAGFIGGLKQMVFGATEAANAAAVVAPSQGADSVVYETQYQTVPCITTGGQTFAIWLNVFYLAPLTYLFVSFFIASYIKRETERTRTEKKAASTANDVDRRLSNAMFTAEQAGWDAAKGLEKEVYGQGNESAVVEEEELAAANPRTLRSRGKASGGRA